MVPVRAAAAAWVGTAERRDIHSDLAVVPVAAAPATRTRMAVAALVGCQVHRVPSVVAAGSAVQGSAAAKVAAEA